MAVGAVRDEDLPSGALRGVTVLDFTWAWAGPHCTRLLADMGADVIKVESASRLDMLRRSGPWPEGEPGGTNRGGNFNQVNRGKRSISINLKSPDGLELALRLAAQVDVMVSNFAGGVMDRLGLGFEAAEARNPGIIWAAVSGFGQTGPQMSHVTFGPPMTMYSGLASVTGYGPQDAPRLLGSTYCDAVAGNHAAIGIVAALIQREVTGRGQSIDVSMLESTVCMIPEMVLDYSSLGRISHPANGGDDPFWFPQGCYQCAGADQWIALSVTTDDLWQAFCGVMDRPELRRLATVGDRRSAATEVTAAVSDWAKPLTARGAAESLWSAGIPAAPANSAKDLVEDEHLSARGFWAAPDQPDVGRRIISGPAFQMSESRLSVQGPAPQLGQHTDEILRELLGLDGTAVAGLRASGALD
jgi:crotonobetainyl-CoA:carnitine CoA-transferase CaiB-like acyl-CoA transferase